MYIYADKNEIKDYCERTGENFTTVRHAQVMYLYHVMNVARSEIAKITGYAVSTISSMKHRYTDLLDFAKRIFSHVKKTFVKALHHEIVWEIEPENRPCAYIMEHFDKDGNFLWLKIGKAKDVIKRAKTHFNDKAYHGRLAKSVVKFCFFCDSEDDALTMENALRKYYKNQNDCADYVRNDRFTAQRYDARILADRRIIAQYDLLSA